jgi:rRNA-processing protein EBP2
LDGGADDFDVQLEDALNGRPSKRHAGTGKGGKPVVSRAKKDSKYGFGGKVGRRAKQNTKESTDSVKPGGAGGGRKFASSAGGKRAPVKRLGKSRRMKGGGK